MEFGLNEDQEVFRATVRTFAREKLAPGYLERAKSERFPWDAYREVAGLGVFGSFYPCRRGAVDHPHDPASLRGLGHDHFHRVRGGTVDGTHFEAIVDPAQHVDRIGLAD